MRDFETRVDVLRSELADSHHEYVTSISSDRMAVSLECAAFLAHLCTTLGPRSVLDLGSGYSSFVVRRYCRQPDVRIVSVDDNPEWLSKTAAYLDSAGLHMGTLSTWQDYEKAQASRPTAFDLIFHDLGNMPLRGRSLPLVLSILEPGRGVLLLDDMHKRDYRQIASGLLNRRGMQYHHLAGLLLDQHGRWPTLALAGNAATSR